LTAIGFAVIILDARRELRERQEVTVGLRQSPDLFLAYVSRNFTGFALNQCPAASHDNLTAFDSGSKIERRTLTDAKDHALLDCSSIRVNADRVRCRTQAI
jgi:hypothetical protein